MYIHHHHIWGSKYQLLLVLVLSMSVYGWAKLAHFLVKGTCGRMLETLHTHSSDLYWEYVYRDLPHAPPSIYLHTMSCIYLHPSCSPSTPNGYHSNWSIGSVASPWYNWCSNKTDEWDHQLTRLVYKLCNYCSVLGKHPYNNYHILRRQYSI